MCKSPPLRASLTGGPTIWEGYNVVTSSKELDTYGKALLVILYIVYFAEHKKPTSISKMEDSIKWAFLFPKQLSQLFSFGTK
jgi:hypothetical protein